MQEQLCERCRKYTPKQWDFLGKFMMVLMAIGPRATIEIALRPGSTPAIHTIKREKKLDHQAVLLGSDWWL